MEAAKDKEKAEKIRKDILEKIDMEVENIIAANTPESSSVPDIEQIIKEFVTILPFDQSSADKLLSDAKDQKGVERLISFLKNVTNQVYESREKSLGETVARDIEKYTKLSVIDTLWIEHLDTLDDLREGIGLRAAGQRDPLVEYKQEAFNLFEKLMSSIDYEIVHRIFKVQIRQEPQIEQVESKGIEVHREPSLSQVKSENVPSPNAASLEKDPMAMSDSELDAEIARLEKEKSGISNTPQNVEFSKDPNEMTSEELDAEIARLESIEKGQQITPNNPMAQSSQIGKPIKVQKVGRNDPCPCGSGLKWKKCGLINAPQHKG